MAKSSRIPDLYDILSSADDYRLKQFLRKYATRNLTLEVRLRAHLIRETQGQKGVNKYGQVLGLLIKHNIHGTIRLTKRSVQLLSEVCQLFLEYQEELLHEGALRDTWEASEAMISQLHVFMDKYHGPDERLVEILVAAYGNLQGLLQQSPAPELRDDVYDMLMKLIDRNPHVIYDLDYNAIISLVYAAPSSPEKDKILSRVLDRVMDPGLLTHQQWKYWCAMLVKIPWSTPQALQRVSHEHLYDVAHLINVSRDRAALRRLIEFFPVPDALPGPHFVQWMRWKFELAEQFSGIDEIREAGLTLLALDPTIQTYRKLRASVSFDLLRPALSTINIPDETRADIYAEESLWDEVIQIALSASSPEIIIRYAEDLGNHTEQFEPATLEIALGYAEHHVGETCAEMIDQLLHTINAERRTGFAQTLLDTLRARFPGRFDGLKVSKRIPRKPYFA
jgi:hypothetical protein